MNNIYHLATIVEKSNVLDCLNEIKKRLINSAQLQVDGSQVNSIDAAGVALLVELSNLAKAGQPLKLVNLSPNITNVCALYQIKL